MGERYPDTVEVRGSKPRAPTIKINGFTLIIAKTFNTLHYDLNGQDVSMSLRKAQAAGESSLRFA